MHDFCLRLQYDENSTMNKSSSSSSLVSIHDGIPLIVIRKNWSSFLLEKINISSSELSNDSFVTDYNFDGSSSKLNNNSSLNDNCFDDSDFDINLKFIVTIKIKHMNIHVISYFE